jgi:hypothetical protein
MTDLRLINCPPGERLRLYRESECREDVTCETLSAINTDQAQVGDMFDKIRAIGSDVDLTQPVTDGGRVAEAWETIHAIGGPAVQVYKRAWRRHTALRDALTPSSNGNLFTLWRLSWILVCRCAFLVRQIEDVIELNEGFDDSPNILYNSATRFPYVDAIGGCHMQLALSTDRIGTYSVRTLMTAIRLLSQSLDAYGWTRSAGDYMYALFMRYAMIVHNPAAYANSPASADAGRWAALRSPLTLDGDGDEEEEEDEEGEGIHVLANDDEDEDDAENFGLAGRDEDPAKVRREALLDPAPLRQGFLDVAERFFFHALWRDHFLRELSAVPPPDMLSDEERKAAQERELARERALAEWRLKSALPAFRNICHYMFTRSVQREGLIADLQNIFPDRVIWPGEREHLLFEYKEEAEGGDAYEVLYRLRFEGYRSMTSTIHFKKPVDDFIDAYIKRESAVANAILKGEDLPPIEGQRLGNDIERVVLLVFERIVDRTLTTDTRGTHEDVFLRSAYVDDRTPTGRKARSPFDVKAWHNICEHGLWPRFAAMWLNYAVAPAGHLGSPGERKAQTLFTPRLIDAMGTWLAYAQNRRETSDILATTSLCKKPDWRLMTLPTRLLPGAPAHPVA